MLTVLTGRSRRLWPCVMKEIGAALEEGADRLLLLTPDQYTLQAELELIEGLRLPGLLNIEVFSPSRLLTRVFSLAGSPKRVRIDARGKAMVLSDLLRLNRKELSVYRDVYERNGLVERLSTCIGDIKRAGLLPDDVGALAEHFDPQDLLHGKLSDIALLYQQYEQRLQGAFLDGEDVQGALLEKLPESGLLAGARIWIYGFDLISPQFLRQIAVMARHATVRLALTFDHPSAPDGAVFQPSRDTLSRLRRFFFQENMKCDHKHVEAPLDAPPEIIYLERSLFSIPIIKYNESAETISLWTAATPYEEASLAAAEILRLAREGARFDQITVITGNLPAYVGPIEAAFSRCDIPYHLAEKRRALSHPLIYGFLSALRCATRGFRLDDAILWLKSGFSGLSSDEAQRLENHAIENGLYGGKWRRTIENGALETLRQRFMTPLEALIQGLRESKDITALLTAAYGLLEQVSAYDTLLALQSNLTERGLLMEASECAQAWKALLQTLDQLQTLIRLEKPVFSSVATVLEAGLSTIDLSVVPSFPGMLQVGELGHMKLGGACRAVLLLGMQDGVMQAAQEGLLSDAEIVKALEYASSDAAFGLLNDSLARLKQINLLDIVAAPTQKLVVSHALTGASGEALRPAVIFHLLEKAFPLAERKSGPAIRWVSPKDALHHLGPLVQAAAKREKGLTEKETETAAWLMHHPETRVLAENILRLLSAPPPRETLPKRLTSRLYAKRTSASRLETFAQCPFQHFVLYGLRPTIRREFAIAADETGIFYHRAIEEYTLSALNHPSWPNISREESDALMDAALLPLQSEWERRPLGDNAMLRAKGAMYCGIARRTAWNYASQMRLGKFKTVMTEIRFGRGEPFPPIVLTLQNNAEVYLEGRIDRVDFYEEEDDIWLRVIDYKSGQAGLNPSYIYAGVQLQLLLYLRAALLAFPGAQAAGAFYSYFKNPLIELSSRDESKIEQLITKELELSGIQLSDVRVVKALENPSRYLKKDGTINKTSRTATPEQLHALMRYANAQATAIAAGINSGEIAPRPAVRDAWSACEWCDYQSVCRLDKTLLSNQARYLASIGYKELLEKIEAERGE